MTNCVIVVRDINKNVEILGPIPIITDSGRLFEKVIE